MKSSSKILLVATCLILFVSLLFVGFHTIIRTESEFIVVKKDYFSLSDSYVNVIDWDPIDYISNKKVTKALIDNGYRNLMELINKRTEKNFPNTRDKLKTTTDKLKDKFQRLTD